MIYNNINNHNNNKDNRIHNQIICYKRFKNKLNKKYKYLVILNWLINYLFMILMINKFKNKVI